MSILGTLRYRLTAALANRFSTFDATAFRKALHDVGIVRGDSVIVHCSLKPTSGFQGKPSELIHAMKDAVGREGLLVMPSMTYTDSSKSYLERQLVMNVLRSPSRMGLVSEVFRRGTGICRSLSPTHPLIAWGDRAQWFIEGHENTELSFGPDSPFARLHDMDSKILFLDCSLETATFMHYVEDRHKHALPFPLYEAEPMLGVVIDPNGGRLCIPTKVLSDESRLYRRESRFWTRARRNGLTRHKRIGNASIAIATCRPLAALAATMASEGPLYFEVANSNSD